MDFTLIINGTLYAPAPMGRQSILLNGEKMVGVGSFDADDLKSAGLSCEVIDAAGCIVMPGLIDPHAHLIGARGETGFASWLPEIPLEQIVSLGITTIVGLLGTDTVTRDPRCLFAKVHQLYVEVISAYMYMGALSFHPVRLPRRRWTMWS